MAQIIEYQQRTQTPTGEGVSIPTAHGQHSIVQAGEDLNRGVDALVRSQEEEARAWSADALAKARLDWTTQLRDRQAQAAPGAPEFTPTIIKDYRDYVDKAVTSAPTKAAQRYLRERLDAFQNSLVEKSSTFEAQARIDYRKDSFASALDTSKKLMNTDPSQFKDVLAERLAEIDGSNMPPIQKSAARQNAVEGLAFAASWSKVQRDPGGFLRAIGFLSMDPATGKVRKSSGALDGATGDAAFDVLSFEKRTQLFDNAVRLKAQYDADIDKRVAEEHRKMSDDAAKDLWGLQASGKLTRNAIDAKKEILTVAEYHSLLTSLKGEAGQKSDPAAFRRVQALISEGDYAAAEKEAFRYHTSGQLSNEHLQSTVTRTRNLDRQEGPKSEYEQSRNYIIKSMDPGPMVPDPVGKQRYADALDQFDRWFASTGKKLPDKDVEAYGKEIVGRYKFVNLGEAMVGLPQPRSGNIPRTPQNLDAVIKSIQTVGIEAQRRRDNGTYNEAEYAQEMAILNRWRKTLEKK